MHVKGAKSQSWMWKHCEDSRLDGLRESWAFITQAGKSGQSPLDFIIKYMTEKQLK